MTSIKPRLVVVEPNQPQSPSKTLDAKRPVPSVRSDAFDDTTDARRQRLARNANDGFVPVPQAKPASIAPPPPPPAPIEIPSVKDAVAELKEEAEKPLDGPEDWTVDAPPPEPQSTEVEIKIAQELEAKLNERGGPKVKVKVENGIAVIDSPDTDPATRTIRATESGGVSASVGVVSGSAESGTVYEIQISAPKGTDLSTINPDDPSTWPPGTKVTKHRTTSDSWSIGANGSIRAIGIGGDLKRYDERGTTETVEKTKDGKVRVTKGPTSASDDSGTIRASLLGIGIKHTSREQRSEQQLETAEFDVTTPQGRAAHEEYKRTGELPKVDGPGVSNVSTTHRVETDLSETSVFQLLGYDIAEIKDKERGTATTVTTRPDGSQTQIDEVSFGEAPNDGAVLVTRERDAAGNPVGDPKKEVRFTVHANNVEATNARIDELNRADGGSRPHVKAGDAVTLPADQETRALMGNQPGSAEALNCIERSGVYGKRAQWIARGADPALIDYAQNELHMTDAEIDAVLATDGKNDPQRDARHVGNPLRADASDIYDRKRAELRALKALSDETGIPLRDLVPLLQKYNVDELNGIADALGRGEPLEKALPERNPDTRRFILNHPGA